MRHLRDSATGGAADGGQTGDGQQEREYEKMKKGTEGRWRAGAKDVGDGRKVARWSRGAGIGEWMAPVAQSA